MPQTRIGKLASLHLKEEEFRKTFTIPAIIFAVEYSDDATVESDIRFIKKEPEEKTTSSDTEVLEANALPLGEVNNSRVLFLEKNPQNISDLENVISVGRAKHNDIIISLPVISKIHAIFRISRNKWCLIEAGSTNGTTINNQRLEPHKPYTLQDNDKINFGGEAPCRFYTPSGLWYLINLYRGLKLSTMFDAHSFLPLRDGIK